MFIRSPAKMNSGIASMELLSVATNIRWAMMLRGDAEVSTYTTAADPALYAMGTPISIQTMNATAISQVISHHAPLRGRPAP